MEDNQLKRKLLVTSAIPEKPPPRSWQLRTRSWDRHYKKYHAETGSHQRVVLSAAVHGTFPRKMWGTVLIGCYHRRVQNQPLKWWHVRWARIAILFGAIFAGTWLIVGIGHGALFLTAPWRQAQRLAKGWPQLAMVPTNLTTQALAPLSNTIIDRYGFKFQLPNKEISRTRGYDSIIAASFPNGGGLMVENPSSEPGIGLISQDFRKDKRAEKLLGRELLQSDFKLMQAAMSTTPDQVKWWRFRFPQNQRAEALLTLKFAALVMCELPSDSTGPIYAISFGQFHGFQCGNPDARPYNAHIEVFDGADRHFAMTIAGQQGHGQVLTQEELNAMVASIRPSPEN